MKRKRSSYGPSSSKESCSYTNTNKTEQEVENAVANGDRTSELALDNCDEDVSKSDHDSLFDDANTSEDEELLSEAPEIRNLEKSLVTQLGAPDIPGLFFDPSILIPEQLAKDVWTKAIDMYFNDKDVNQIMLFQRSTKNALTNEGADNSTL